MRIKNRISLLSFLVVFLLASGAQLIAQTNEVELTRAVIQTQRQAIVAENMRLSEEEACQFWPLYRQYRGETAKIGYRFVKVIMTSADNYPGLPEDKAEWIIDEYLAIEKPKPS